MKADTRKTRRDGDCYKASAEGLLRMAEQLGNELRLAHGTCTLTAGHLKGKSVRPRAARNRRLGF